MNYQKIYNQLIDKAKNRNYDGYTEKHHIIPRCMNGTDDKDNLVRLLPEEHYLAHQLLVKIYPGNNKLIYALKMMTQCGSGKMIRNNKEFSWIRKLNIESRTGENSPSYGKNITDETREKMRLAKKDTVPWNKGKIFVVKEIKEKKLPSTIFKKDIEPWNKGTKGVMEANSGSFKEGHIPVNKGKKMSDEFCKMRSDMMKGKPSPHKGKKLGPNKRTLEKRISEMNIVLMYYNFLQMGYQYADL